MPKEENKDEFYDRFKIELDKNHTFPGSYTYKFIVPNNSPKATQVLQLFDDSNPQYSNKESRTGKYTSLTITVFLLDSDSVIYFYKEVSKIEGVHML